MATTVYRYCGNEIEEIAQPDAASLYGDVVFSTFRAFGSFVPWWDRHLERLKCGAAFLEAGPGWELILQNLSEGKSKFSTHFQGKEWMGRPTLRREAEGLQFMYLAWEAKALRSDAQKLVVSLSERKRDLPANIKGGNYTIETKGRQWAIDQGMDDILFWHGPQKNISETSTSNIFLINKQGELLTPAINDESCLAGIVREQVLLLGQHLGLQVKEREIYLSELAGMTEAFSTNCGQLIHPIDQIGDCFLSSHHENSLTNKIKKEFNFMYLK